MGSWVPPALTTTFLPATSPPLPRTYLSAPIIVSTSDMRPGPRLGQLAGEVRHLVRGYAAADPQHHRPVREVVHLLLTPVHLEDDAQPLQGQVHIDGVYRAGLAGDQLGVAAGANHLR